MVRRGDSRCRDCRKEAVLLHGGILRAAFSVRRNATVRAKLGLDTMRTRTPYIVPTLPVSLVARSRNLENNERCSFPSSCTAHNIRETLSLSLSLFRPLAHPHLALSCSS